jgi:hypothetical protein
VKKKVVLSPLVFHVCLFPPHLLFGNPISTKQIGYFVMEDALVSLSKDKKALIFLARKNLHFFSVC